MTAAGELARAGRRERDATLVPLISVDSDLRGRDADRRDVTPQWSTARSRPRRFVDRPRAGRVLRA
jgi:hypothetical protein